jgi:NADPH:quinone reductase-like Zn-dependent oxidoreductase
MRALYLAARPPSRSGSASCRHPSRDPERCSSKSPPRRNHPDLFVLGGIPGITPEMPHVGGADGAGVIAALGPGVSGWREGDEVVLNPGLSCGECEFCRRGEQSMCVRFSLLGEHVPGTFAEFVAVPAINLGRRPAHQSWAEAAGFPLTFLTAWRMLTSRGRLQEGETVLIHGIGGGVALAALAIARRLGARVIVTSSSPEKLARARELGADETIDYGRQNVARAVRALTDKRGVDLVVETVGAATWLASLRSAAKGGRIVTCGATTGPSPAEEIRLVFWNQLSILGSTMGSRGDWEAMLRAVSDWGLHPVVDSVLPLEQGRDGYERMARGGQFGKVVLQVKEPPAAPSERDSA